MENKYITYFQPLSERSQFPTIKPHNILTYLRKSKIFSICYISYQISYKLLNKKQDKEYTGKLMNNLL